MGALRFLDVGVSRPSPLAQVVADGRLVEPLTLVEELGDVFAGVLQEVVLHQELDPLQGMEQMECHRPRWAMAPEPTTRGRP